MDPIDQKHEFRSSDGRTWAEEKPADVTQKLESVKEELEAENSVIARARLHAKAGAKRAGELKVALAERASHAAKAMRAKVEALSLKISQYFKRSDSEEIEQH